MLLRGPELLEGRTRQDLTLGANAQSYWASRRPKTSLQPSSVCVLLTLVLLRLSCVSLSTAAQDGCRSFHLLSGVGGWGGVWFWTESLMLPSRACLQNEAAFLVLSQSLSAFQMCSKQSVSWRLMASFVITGKIRD